MSTRESMSDPARPATPFGSIVLHWAPVVACMALISYLSLHPRPYDLGPVGLADTWGHMLAYTVLSAFLARAAHGCAGFSIGASVTCAVLAAVAYGLAHEVAQIFVANRHATVLDALADSIGALLGAVLFLAGTVSAAAWRRARQRRAWYREHRGRLRSARHRALRGERLDGRRAKARPRGRR